MTTATRANATAFAARWRPPSPGLFSDLKFRHGIKLGLAGTLALFVTQVIRLPHSNWSILTVLILMLAKYVGASAVKAIMRALGTIAGALIGIWLVGGYTSTPAIFLPVFFLIIAYSSYQFGKFPASQLAYAHFLVGVTTIAVVTSAIFTPELAWQIGLDRALEILVGIGSSLLVTALVWPRYARDEFAEVARKAVGTVSHIFAMQACASRENDRADVGAMRQTFDKQLFILGNLLQSGSRESALFFAHLSNYEFCLVVLIRLFRASLEMRPWSKGESFILDRMSNELEELQKTISEEFRILAEPQRGEGKLPPCALDESFAAFEKRVRELRDQGIFLAAPIETAMEFAGHFDALRSIRDNLNDIRGAFEHPPGSAQPQARPAPQQKPLPAIDWFWLRIGIRGSLAATIAVVFIDWLNPPGAAVIPFMAWTMSIQGLLYLRAGGTGDQRVFHNGIIATIAMILTIILLLLATPLLAGYTAMNLALFLILFTFGYLTAGVIGINVWMMIGLLSISSFVSLNPQEPVPSQTIIDTFLGVITGFGIGAVVSRLVWPVLPQRILQQRLLTLVARSHEIIGKHSISEKGESELAILSVEALQATQRMRTPGCPHTEKARILALVRTLLALATRMKALVSGRDHLPEIVRETLWPKFDSLDVGFSQMLDAFAECFRQGHCRRTLPSIREALSDMIRTVEEIRNSGVLAHQRLEIPLQMLDVANRYRSTAVDLEECSRLLQTLQLHRYWGDYVL